MIQEFENLKKMMAVPNGYKYFSDALGRVTYLQQQESLEEKLPVELIHAFRKVWSPEIGPAVYLVQWQGKYGIAVELEYGFDSLGTILQFGKRAWKEGISSSERIAAAKRKARLMARRFPKAEVLLCTEERFPFVAVFIPWDSKRELLEEVAIRMLRKEDEAW